MLYTLIIHIAATFFMTGLIWMVQIVHYPLFKVINSDEFQIYGNTHSKLITFIVGPVMTVELITGMIIAASGLFSGLDHILFLVSFGFLILIWISTAIFQIPHHRRLTKNKDIQNIEKLITYNWIRTVSWTIRMLILLYLLLILLSD